MNRAGAWLALGGFALIACDANSDGVETAGDGGDPVSVTAGAGGGSSASGGRGELASGGVGVPAAGAGGRAEASGGAPTSGGASSSSGGASQGSGGDGHGGVAGAIEDAGAAGGGLPPIRSDASGVDDEYPAGPYGKAVGDTIENYAFRGYVNLAGDVLSNTLALGDFSMNDARLSGASHALVHLSAFYCPGCRSAAIDLGTLAEPVIDAGGLIIEVLFDGDLSPWVETYDLRITTVAPVAGNTLVASAADREHAFIVDLSTMEIVWTVFGSYGTTSNSSAKQGLAEMRRLLE